MKLLPLYDLGNLFSFRPQAVVIAGCRSRVHGFGVRRLAGAFPSRDLSRAMHCRGATAPLNPCGPALGGGKPPELKR